MEKVIKMDKRSKILVAMSLQLGFSVVAATLFCVGVGIYIDRHFSSGSIGLMCGFLFGFLSSMYFVFQIVQRTNKKL